jgi:thioredoxin-dependent peroxiredoxin
MAAKKSVSKPASPGHELVGSKAPAFELPDSSGATVKLRDLLGRAALVLYFYPKDMTPGCTREACGFRDRLEGIKEAGAQVVGISGDPPGSHQKFAERNALTFTLLSDADHRVARFYGVYKKKSLYGREFMGVERSTFLIDKAGVIRKVYPKVSVDGHAEKVLEDLRQMG